MPIETLLKRCFHGVALLLIATIAYFQARGAAQLLGLALLSREAKDGPTSKPATDAVPPATPKNGQVILDRNPFDSSTGPVTNPAQDKSRGMSVNVDASDPLSWPACEGIQVLIVTESRDPWWSLATLQAVGEARPRARRVGDGVAEQHVAFIGYNPRQQAPSVWLEGGGRLCQSTLFQASPKTSAPMAETPAPTPTPTPRAGAVASRLRAVPEQKDGKLVGLRLFGIRPDSLLGTLGLRSGDRLESINGFEIATPEKALQAYAQLRTAGHLRVRLTRVGRPVQIDLHIS